MSARQLEALIRITEAHAKAHLRTVVLPQDVEESIRIMKESLEVTATDELGRFDIDARTGNSSINRSAYTAVLQTVKSNPRISIDKLMELCPGINETKMTITLGKLMRDGDIYEPTRGRYEPL